MEDRWLSVQDRRPSPFDVYRLPVCRSPRLPARSSASPTRRRDRPAAAPTCRPVRVVLLSSFSSLTQTRAVILRAEGPKDLLLTRGTRAERRACPERSVSRTHPRCLKIALPASSA